MTRHQYNMGDQVVTVLVMGEDEFESLVGLLEDNSLLNEKQLTGIRAASHLPLVTKGTKTRVIFDVYNVETNLLSAIVRGQGQKVLQSHSMHLTDSNTAKEIFDEACKDLAEEDKKDIMGRAVAITEIIVNGGDPSEAVLDFIQSHGQFLPGKDRAKLAEQTLSAMAQTFWMSRQQLSLEEWKEYFPQYVNRILVGLCLTMKSYRN